MVTIMQKLQQPFSEVLSLEEVCKLADVISVHLISEVLSLEEVCKLADVISVHLISEVLSL